MGPAPIAPSCSVGSGGGGGIGGYGGAGARNGIDDCGPDVDEDCCTTLLVNGGSYYRSYNGIDYTDDSYPATVSSFYLDRFEVTVGRFRKFVEAGMGTRPSAPAQDAGEHPLIPESGWQTTWNDQLPDNTTELKADISCDSDATWTASPGANENKPINCVSWYVAFAFCAWDGGRLPTEAEWNYAAAGGDEHRYYPWSDPPGSTDIDGTYAVHDGCCGIPAVGFRSPKGDGRWGQADLGGSMWEWNLDWYGTYPMPCNDCASLDSAVNKVERGGSWANVANDLRAAHRNVYSPPAAPHEHTGLRCARSPVE